MTTTTGAALNHPVAALIVGAVWLVAATVFALFLICMYTAYGVAYGCKWGYEWWAARYKGAHRRTGTVE